MGRKSRGKSGQTPAEILADRNEAIGLMNAPLKKKLAQLERKLADSRADNLRFYHDLGKICRDIQDDTGTYTAGAFRLIERALATQARVLRKAANFARHYTDEDLEELIQQVDPDTHFTVHWGHVSALLTLPTREKRQMWAKRAVKNHYKPEQLLSAMQQHYGRAPKHGRTHELPKTTPAQLRQIKEESNKWLGKQRTAWNGERLNAFNNMTELPPDQWTAEMLEDLRVTKAAMQGIIEEATANITRFDSLIARAEECLEQQAQQAAQLAAAAQSHGKESRRIEVGTADPRRSRRSA